MALINCPECGKQISDTTPSCPHCGYRLSIVGESKVAETPIGEVKTSIGKGVGLIFLGMLTFVFFGAPAFVFSGPFSLLFFALGVFFIVKGVQRITGVQEVCCPYCGNFKAIGKKKQTFKCRKCKHTSVRKGNLLVPM